MAVKKANFVGMELKWLEAKAEEMKSYCDEKKFSELTDRIVEGKVVAKIEEQIRCIRETLKDYIQIVSAIDELRDKNNTKKALVRGDQELSPLESGEI